MNICMNYKMLESDIKDISVGIDVNKTNASKECDICHYWYFLDKGFKFESYLCSCCHDLRQKDVNFNDVVVFVKGSGYRIHFWYRNKDDAINIMKNSDLSEKSRFYRFFLLYKRLVIKLLIIKEIEKTIKLRKRIL